jgi:septal ring factor EnvC (AmiA/AmiB activator)
MKSGKLLCFIYLLLLFLMISACQDDKEKKNDYLGLSNLISERNKARHGVDKKTSGKDTESKSVEENIGTTKKESDSKEEEVSSVVLYEEKVDIIDSESRRTLAKGIAYINKKGQIIRIKILRE